ncbi:hypothetical protein AB1N83_008176, partial [Pleurotus pulmonarius]
EHCPSRASCTTSTSAPIHLSTAYGPLHFPPDCWD